VKIFKHSTTLQIYNYFGLISFGCHSRNLYGTHRGFSILAKLTQKYSKNFSDTCV